jgi:hypothetical protein
MPSCFCMWYIMLKCSHILCYILWLWLCCWNVSVHLLYAYLNLINCILKFDQLSRWCTMFSSRGIVVVAKGDSAEVVGIKMPATFWWYKCKVLSFDGINLKSESFNCTDSIFSRFSLEFSSVGTHSVCAYLAQQHRTGDRADVRSDPPAVSSSSKPKRAHHPVYQTPSTSQPGS